MTDPTTTTPAPPVYTVKRSAICRDGVPIFVLVRSSWGDGAQTHGDLDQWEREIAALLSPTPPDNATAEASASDYLARFPADHRASADRAYQDGFSDGAADA